jgi:hypothetical protein
VVTIAVLAVGAVHDLAKMPAGAGLVDSYSNGITGRGFGF